MLNASTAVLTLIFPANCPSFSWGMGRYSEAVVLKNAAQLLGLITESTQNGTRGLKLDLVTQVVKKNGI